MRFIDPTQPSRRAGPMAFLCLFLVGVARADGGPEGLEERGEIAPGAEVVVDEMPAFATDGMRDVFGHQLRGELVLLRAAFPDLPPAARRAIREAGERAVDDAARRLEEAIAVYDHPESGTAAEVVIGGRAVSPEAMTLVDAGAAIRGSLAAALADQVGPERGAGQLAAYARREADRRRSVVRRIVLLLDLDLHLSAEQWDAIEGDLLDGWDERFAVRLSPFYRAGSIERPRRCPGLDYGRIVPHLDAPQAACLGEACDREFERSAIAAWLRNWRLDMIPTTLDTTEDRWWHP